MINCPKCGADNKENSNFCEECGEKLESSKICPECGKENVEIANFCENCGTNLEISKPSMKSLKTRYMENPDFLENKPKDNSRKKVSLNLTPAESLIILDHKKHKSSPKDILKATLIDLIFKNVFKLDVQEVEKKGIFGKKIVKKIYLSEGKNFNMPLKLHEEVFRDCLPSKADSKRLRKLQQCVNNSYRNDYAKKKLLEPLALEGYFDVEKKFLGKKYSLSSKGIETRQMILELKYMGRDLEEWMENDPERAKAYLLVGGSNVFLTDDYSFEWFKANSGKIKRLFANKSKINAFLFFNFGWYGAFRMHNHRDLDIDFDDFSDFDDFGDFDDFIGDNIEDIFSDSDVFDTFDSIDFSDFDSGFDSGFDGGGDFGGDGGGGE